MLLPASAVALALLAQAPSTNAAPPAPATPARTANAAAKTNTSADAVMCQRVEDTGTRFSHRVCHTNAEWAQITADAKSSTEDFQRTSSMTTPH